MKDEAKTSHEKRWLAFLLFIVILPFELNGFYNPVLAETPWLYWSVEILSWVVLPTGIYLFGLRRKLFTNEEIGFHFSVAGKRNLVLFVITIIVISFILHWTFKTAVSTGRSLFPINYGKIPFDYKTIEPAGGFLHWLSVVYFSLTAGFVEEIYCRGMFRQLFTKKLSGVVLYVILSSLIFSSAHWEGGVRNLFLTFCFGVVCSSLYACVKNLWPFVLGHCLVDFLWLE